MVKWFRNGLTPKQRFYRYIETDPNTGCWEFIGTRNKRGYGVFTFENKKVPAHRFSYQIHVGNIPEGRLVLHKCDNPPCVNPEHLFIGTQFDNMRDMVQKGRNANTKGTNNPRASIYDDSVIQIRDLWDTGASIKEIAIHFMIPKSTVRNIISNVTWKHLPRCKRLPSNRGSHLTENDIFEIKRLGSLKRISQEFIGNMFRISQAQISKIVCGESWK